MLGYLDPGSGSLIISAIVAGFAGLAVVIKSTWHRIAAVFSPARRRALAEAREARAERAERATAPAARASGED